MRGLASAFLVAFAHYAGWALATLKNDCLFVTSDIVLIGGLVSSIIASLPTPRFHAPTCARWSFYSFLLTLASCGYLLGCCHLATRNLSGWFIVMTLTAFLFAMRCLGAFKTFTWEFPKAIYRDFYTYQLKQPESKAEEK